MNHVESQILDRVARLFPAPFARLAEHRSRHDGFVDPTVARCEREVQFYLAYLEYIAPLKAAGLSFSYPRVSARSKEISTTATFDLALAAKLVAKNAPVVCNDFHLSGPERVLVVSGPKTPAVAKARLRELIGDGARWPSRDEFEKAGLSGMRSSIYVHEGPAYWATRLGVQRRSERGRTGTARWTEQRLRTELTQFCAGREVWPTEREFIAAGRRAPYAAASRSGGVTRWATELGLRRERTRSASQTTAAAGRTQTKPP